MANTAILASSPREKGEEQMRQVNYNRAEEYITLRSEMQLLSSFARQILYWSVLLVIGGLGWHLNKPANERIPAVAFSFFMYLLVALSCVGYVIYTNQVYRIGSYLAVFWESGDSDRRMQWHRFNRKGTPGGFLPDAAVFVYSGTAGLIVLFLGFLTFYPQLTREAMANMSMVFFGTGLAFYFPRLRFYLQTQRDKYEREWRIIRASSVRRAEIHDEYETVPLEDVPILRSPL